MGKEQGGPRSDDEQSAGLNGPGLASAAPPVWMGHGRKGEPLLNSENLESKPAGRAQLGLLWGLLLTP